MKNFNEIYEEVLKVAQKLGIIENNILKYGLLKEKAVKAFCYVIFLIICCIITYVQLGLEALIEQLKFFGVMVIFFGIVYGPVLILSFTMFNPKKLQFKEYKKQILQTFIKSYNENLNYYVDGRIPEYIYDRGGFEKYVGYYSEDLISGNINNHNMMIGEVITDAKLSIPSKENSPTKLFFGLVVVSEFDNIYNGMLKIHSNKGYLQKILKNKIKIEMDSNEFEKRFDIFADDKIQAMQLLTSDIMDMMVSFIKETGIDFEVTVVNSNIYLRFKTGNLLDMKSKKDMTDFDTFKRSFDILNFATGITELIIQAIEKTHL